jgi:hypothetical protein
MKVCHPQGEGKADAPERIAPECASRKNGFVRSLVGRSGRFAGGGVNFAETRL